MKQFLISYLINAAIKFLKKQLDKNKLDDIQKTDIQKKLLNIKTAAEEAEEFLAGLKHLSTEERMTLLDKHLANLRNTGQKKADQ